MWIECATQQSSQLGSVRDERHQHEWWQPRQHQARAIAEPAERRPPGSKAERQAETDDGDDDRRTRVDTPAREERHETRDEQEPARRRPEDEDAAVRRQKYGGRVLQLAAEARRVQLWVEGVRGP